jgi:hypothetical protein
MASTDPEFEQKAVAMRYPKRPRSLSIKRNSRDFIRSTGINGLEAYRLGMSVNIPPGGRRGEEDKTLRCAIDCCLSTERGIGLITDGASARLAKTFASLYEMLKSGSLGPTTNTNRE